MATSFNADAGFTVDKVFEKFVAGVNTAGTNLKTAMDSASQNVNDPTNLISMQKELANYNMALMVQSSVVKSIEETAKSITQKL
jgi:type III secretion apparatus needle protein